VTLQIEGVQASITKYLGYLEILGVNMAEQRALEAQTPEGRLSRTSSMITLRSTSSRISSMNDPSSEVVPTHFDVQTPSPGRRRSSAADSDSLSRSDTHSRSEANAADADSLNTFRPRRNSLLSQASIPELSAAEVASIDSGPPPVLSPSPAALRSGQYPALSL